jgi:hypothetical protein
LVGIGKRQWSQEHSLNHAKDGAVRTDPKGERQHNDDGESGRFEQHPEGEAEIT